MTDMPRYNPTPDAFQPAAAPKAPPVMNTIFLMLMGAALLSIVATIFGVISTSSPKFRQQVEDQLTASGAQGITPGILDGTVLFTLVSVVAVGVASVILYVLIGLFIKKGMGWARIVGAILAVASLSQLWGMTMPGGIAAILQVLLGIAAMVLCFTGPAAAFFTAKKNFRLASKGR